MTSRSDLSAAMLYPRRDLPYCRVFPLIDLRTPAVRRVRLLVVRKQGIRGAASSMRVALREVYAGAVATVGFDYVIRDSVAVRGRTRAREHRPYSGHCRSRALRSPRGR